MSLGGTLLHFLYDRTQSPLAALVSSVNESTREHMKLLLFPLLLFAVIEFFAFGKEYENYPCIKLKGTLLGLALIPVLFYTLRGIFGTTPDAVNIAIFFVAAAAVFLYEARLFSQGSKPCQAAAWTLAAMLLLVAVFFVFTFRPPEIPLFRDPIDGSYGLRR